MISLITLYTLHNEQYIHYTTQHTLHPTHCTLHTTFHLGGMTTAKQMKEDRGQRTEDRGQRTEDRGIQADLIFIFSTIGCHFETTVVVEIVLVKLPTVLFPLELKLKGRDHLVSLHSKELIRIMVYDSKD